MSTIKEEVEQLVHRLPDDATLDDIQYQLHVMEKMQRSRASEQAGGLIDHQAIVDEMASWRMRTTGRLT